MAYDVIKWRELFVKHGHKWAIWSAIGGICTVVAGMGTMFGCGYRSVTASPGINMPEQTLDIGWFNFKPAPVNTLIDSMVPGREIVLVPGKIIIPSINSYDDFLHFSNENRDALILLRDVGVPFANVTRALPITDGQRTLVDNWVLASHYKAATDAGIALIVIGMLPIISSIGIEIYLRYRVKLLIKHAYEQQTQKAVNTEK